jgi:dienelactone hydrolase
MPQSLPFRPGLRRCVLAVAIAAAMLPGALLRIAPAAASEPQANPTAQSVVFAAPAVIGTLTLPLAGEGRRLPAVVLVHDALGPDPRSERYIAQLGAAGIAVLELLSEEVLPVLPLAAEALAADPRIDGSRIGVLGFGAGAAAAAMARVPFAARALLYPGCATLPADRAEPPASARTPLLLLHGGADPANSPAACAAAAEALARGGAAVRRVEYAGAGFAWDRPAFGQEGRSLLPAPGSTERVPAVPWPELAELSATQVAGFFALALGPARR